MVVPNDEWSEYHVHIVSINSFPTGLCVFRKSCFSILFFLSSLFFLAAGLASSASGYSCLVKALSDLYCVEEMFENELTTIARQGSGSACRFILILVGC